MSTNQLGEVWYRRYKGICLKATTTESNNVVHTVHVIYIPWLRGVYCKYTTRAQRYQLEAEARTDIERRVLYIHHIHREDIVYIIYIL